MVNPKYLASAFVTVGELISTATFFYACCQIERELESLLHADSCNKHLSHMPGIHPLYAYDNGLECCRGFKYEVTFEGPVAKLI